MARRQQAESNRQRFEPISIKTASDIKRVLAKLNLDCKQDDVTLSINMTGTDTDNRSKTFQVSTKTKTSSARDILTNGLNIIKQREDAYEKIADQMGSVDVNGKKMKSPLVISESSFTSIDPVIDRVLGGYRHGHFIQWDLSDGFTYRYDIFVHKLTRFKKEQ
jgi:hypothetical protein